MDLQPIPTVLQSIPVIILYKHRIFTLQAITEYNIFYGDANESDENANVVLYDKEFNLLSDNYFASNELALLAADVNANIFWESELFAKYRAESLNQHS